MHKEHSKSQVQEFNESEDQSGNIWIPQFDYKGNYCECQEILKEFGVGGTGDGADSKSNLKTAIIKAHLSLSNPIFEERIRITPDEDKDIVINSDF